MSSWMVRSMRWQAVRRSTRLTSVGCTLDVEDIYRDELEPA